LESDRASGWGVGDRFAASLRAAFVGRGIDGVRRRTPSYGVLGVSAVGRACTRLAVVYGMLSSRLGLKMISFEEFEQQWLESDS